MNLSIFLNTFREAVKQKFSVKRFSALTFSSILDVDTERYRKWEQGTMPNFEEDRSKLKAFFEIENLEDIPEGSLKIGMEKITWNDGVFDSKVQSQTKTPAEAGGRTTEVLPDPAAPGIYQDIVQALIRNSDAMAKALDKMGSLSDALLEERQYIRSTAVAVADIAQKLNNRTSLDELKAQMDLNFQHDEQVDLFLAEQVAASAGIPTEVFLERMHNAMSGGPRVIEKSKTVETGKLSKA